MSTAWLKGAIDDQRFDDGQFTAAAQLFDKLIVTDALEHFLTVPAYQKVLALGG